MIRVKCPQCTKVLGLKDDVSGQMARCPACQATFKVPSKPTTSVSKPKKDMVAPKTEAKTNTTPPDGDELNPYAFAIDTGPKDKEAIRDDRTDAMVKDAQRAKKRNAAWELIGKPAKMLKVNALVEVSLWTCAYLFTIMAVVLQIHQLDQWEAKAGRDKDRPHYVWPVKEFVHRDFVPGNLFFIATGIFIPILGIYGLLLAAAEAMKKLENYRLAMAGAIISIIAFPPIGILALLVLLKKNVQHEFEVSERRNQGIYDEVDEEEQEDEADEDDESEETEEAEEEVAVEE